MKKLHEKNPRLRELRADEREKVKEMLKSASPSLIIHQNTVRNRKDISTSQIIDSGNLLNQYDPGVLKVCKSEINLESQFDPDDIVDLIKFQNFINDGKDKDFDKNFFLKISIPFEVVCMSFEQLKAMKFLTNYDINLDATGNLSRKSNSNLSIIQILQSHT